MFRTLLITTAIIAMVCYIGCKDNAGAPISVTSPDDVTPLTKDDSVIANAYLVRDAAKAWARENGGDYARDLFEELPDGRNLIDFLPDGAMLMNPYEGVKSNPVPHFGAWPGEVGYTYYRGVSPYGYQITGIGPVSGEVIVRLELDPRDFSP